MRNLLLYALAAAGAWYVAILYNSKGFLFLFMAAVLLPPFFIFLLWHSRRKLTCRLALAPDPEEPGEYQACLGMENHSCFYLARVKAVVVFWREGSKGTRRARLSGSIGASGRAKLKKTVGRLEPGVWKAECKSLVCYDCLGLFRLKKRIRQQVQVMVLPACYELTVQAGIRTKLFLSDSERHHPLLGGDDPAEILNLREYQKGDRMNRIHWKLSARTGSLLVAEMSLPVGCNVVVFLDAAPAGMGRKARIAYWEVAHTLSQALLGQDCPHYLVWKDGEGQRVRRKAVREAEDLHEFWDVALGSQMARCLFPEEYGQEFQGEPYATSIQWNQELELYCNGSFQVKIEPEQVKEQLLGLELTV